MTKDSKKDVAQDMSKQEVRDAILVKRQPNHRERGRTDTEKRERYVRYEIRKKTVFESEKLVVGIQRATVVV